MNKVILLLGPTGVGKTDLCLEVAKYFQTQIISADSRQVYKDLPIGTASPTSEQLETIKHHLVGMLHVSDYYSASEFEQEALQIIETIHQTNEVAIVTGGSMMYIDAIWKGLDNIPTIDEELRQEVWMIFEKEGLESIQKRLKLLDPDFYNQVDLKNHKRVIHALEVCLMTGKPYSALRTNIAKQRPFKIIKIGLMREREELYNRINQRVDEMIRIGLIDEAKQFQSLKHLNSLNTVGYKEIFSYLNGDWTLDFAIDKMKQNTRIYSRKQMTWFKRDKEINWINLSETTQTEALEKIIKLTEQP